MATPAVITLSSTNIQSATGGEVIQLGPLTITIPTPVPQINELTFGSGTFITTAGPVGASYCLIQPPSAGTVSLTLKGITGDTGIPLGAANPSLISFFNPSVSNSVGLTSAAAITGFVILTWF